MHKEKSLGLGLVDALLDSRNRSHPSGNFSRYFTSPQIPHSRTHYC